MTQYPDKPKRKRKEKPKRGSNTRWWLLILLLLLLLIIGLAVLYILSQSPNKLILDSAPTCEFESNPYMFIQGREENYITDFAGTTRIDVSDQFRIPTWLVGNPYVWGHNGNATTTRAIDLESGKVIEFTSPTDLGALQFQSPSLRYYLGLGEYEQGNNLTRYFIIFDAQTETTVFEGASPTTEQVDWSPDETQVLLYSRHISPDAQLFNLTTLSLSSIRLPSDLMQPIGWLDNERVIYRTKASRLRVWQVATNNTTAYTDVRFGESYRAGGQEKGVNMQFYMPQRQWISGITANDEVHLFNVRDNRHLVVSIDMSQEFDYKVYNRFVYFDYKSDSGARYYKFYYPDTEMLIDFMPATEDRSQFSPDGKFVFFVAPSGLSDSVIQNVMTGETMTLGEPAVTDMDWTYIEGQSYLVYAVPRDDGANTYYLLNLDTKVRCGMGSYFADIIEIQPEDWMR